METARQAPVQQDSAKVALYQSMYPAGAVDEQARARAADAIRARRAPMRLWVSAALTPYGSEYGLVAVVAGTRNEAIAKAREQIEKALAAENYVPGQCYARALLDNLESMDAVDSGVVIDWSPAERRR